MNLRDKEEGEPTTKREQALRPRLAERVLVLVLLMPVVIAFGFRVLLVFNMSFDPDEYQYLHHAWMVMNGFLPYRDFFHNHTPGLWYLLAPLAWLFDERSAYLFACRIVMVVLTLAIFFMVYRLTATSSSYVRPIFSIFLLNIELWFVWKTLEVRPDQVVILSWLFGVWVLVRSRGPIPSRTYGVSGLSVGMGLLFSPKALFAIAALGGALLLLRPIGRLRAPAWRDIGLFGLMSLTPIACLLLLMWSRDEGWPFLLVQQAFLFNVRYPSRFSGLRYFNASLNGTPLFWMLALTACVLVVRRIQRCAAEQERRALVMLASSTLAAGLAYFVFLPVAYSQSLLPFITFLAILGAECGGWLDGRIARTHQDFKSRGLVACLAGLLAVLSFHSLTSIANALHPLSRTNREQVERITSILRVTTRSDAILDGYAMYVMRPQASFYGVMFLGLRVALKSGSMRYDIPERCVVNGCPVIILDTRLLEVAPWMGEFVRANYAPSSVERVYLRRGIGNRDRGAPDQ